MNKDKTPWTQEEWDASRAHIEAQFEEAACMEAERYNLYCGYLDEADAMLAIAMRTGNPVNALAALQLKAALREEMI